MLVLGIDPGIQETGYGYVESTPGAVRLLQTGVIRTPPNQPLPARLHSIYQHLHRLFSDQRPSVVALEDVYAAARYPRTAIIMGHVRGVVCLAAAEAEINVVPLPPASVKQAIAGFGAASKRQIQSAVARFLGSTRPLDQHVADAVAMALTVLSREGQLIGLGTARLPATRALRTGSPARISASGLRG